VKISGKIHSGTHELIIASMHHDASLYRAEKHQQRPAPEADIQTNHDAKLESPLRTVAPRLQAEVAGDPAAGPVRRR
jgi:hypothetical protein